MAKVFIFFSVYSLFLTIEELEKDFFILKLSTKRPPAPHNRASINTAWKVSKYGVFSGPHFPAFGMEYFLVRIFPHSDWIRRDTSYLSVFSPNAGKYGPEKSPYLDTFHAMQLSRIFGKRKITTLLCFRLKHSPQRFCTRFSLMMC